MARSYWLLKTEPSDYSFDDLERDGRTVWDGVGNNLALIHLREIRRGDRAMIYHTGSERAAVGIAKIVKGTYPDPDRDDPKRVVVDVSVDRRLPEPVTLKRIKREKSLADWDLVRNPRLSVMPVTKQQWDRVLKLAQGSGRFDPR